MEKYDFFVNILWAEANALQSKKHIGHKAIQELVNFTERRCLVYQHKGYDKVGFNIGVINKETGESIPFYKGKYYVSKGGENLESHIRSMSAVIAPNTDSILHKVIPMVFDESCVDEEVIEEIVQMVRKGEDNV